MDLEKLREEFIKKDFIPYQNIDAGWFFDASVEAHKELIEKIGGFDFERTYQSLGDKVKFHLSCSPTAFVKIGTHKSDSGSCWRNGGGYEYNKYCYGIRNGTFVMLLEGNSPAVGGPVIMRMVGLYDKNTLHFHNFRAVRLKDGYTIEPTGFPHGFILFSWLNSFSKKFLENNSPKVGIGRYNGGFSFGEEVDKSRNVQTVKVKGM